MDKKQLAQRAEELNALYLENISRIKIIEKKPNFSKTGSGKVGDILEQRHSQRTWLFRFSLAFVSLTTAFVFFLVGAQAYLNFHGHKVRLVEPATLQIIVTGVFVQFIGLVGIITKSIWDDKPYIDGGLIKEKEK